MDSHGQALVQDESSAEIASLVKLLRLAERIVETHASKESTGDPQMEALTAEVNIQMFLNELQEWRRSTPDIVKNMRMFVLISLSDRICLWSNSGIHFLNA
jgi:hypothetical protein